VLKILTIAGSDSSGGAGIQADLKTIAAHGMYGMSVITALTAQNTTGVFAVQESAPEFTAAQLDAVFTDIFPDAVKIGMVSSVENIQVIADRLRHYKAQNIVLDPVMMSTSGAKLISDGAIDELMKALVPLARVITPNIFESGEICGFAVTSEADMQNAAETIGEKFPCAVLVKGGHGNREAADLLYDSGKSVWIRAGRINHSNTHGTGCTLSSAIACRLAEGKSLEDSVRLAKAYLTGSIAAMLDLGAGPGPLDHGYAQR
jgi:hydroxymethylpyrimidine/phosphomethylpyrimidine kinase